MYMQGGYIVHINLLPSSIQSLKILISIKTQIPFAKSILACRDTRMVIINRSFHVISRLKIIN